MADLATTYEKAKQALELWKAAYPYDYEEISVLESIVADIDDLLKDRDEGAE